MNPSKNTTLVLSNHDIEKIIFHHGLNSIMDVLTEELNQAIKSLDDQKVTIPIRSGFNYQTPYQGLVELMPLYDHGKEVVIKVVGYHPDNPNSFGLPTILSTISAYDTTTGHLKGLVDGGLLTAFRTGAASAVASKYLAHPESSVLGLIGCGAQSITQLHALSRIFPLKKVLIYDVDPSAVNSFTDRCKSMNLSLSVVFAEIAEIVSSSDILCTATSIDVGAGPLFEKWDVHPHLHINAVGSDFPGKIELPLDLLEKGFVCPDFKEQAIREGESQQLAREQIGPELVELIQQNEKYPNLQNQLTIFDSTGWPLEDQVVMELFIGYAKELGIGQEIEIEGYPQDAKSPYHFLNVLSMEEAKK